MTLIHFNDCPIPFRAHKFCFSWPGVFDGVKVSVSIPNLEGNEYKVAGDWGPEYNIVLRPHQSIDVEYWNSSGEDVQSISLRPDVLNIESPMMAYEREKTPWVFVIEDPERFLTMRLYVDGTGRFHHAEVKRHGAMAFTAMPERQALRLAAG